MPYEVPKNHTIEFELALSHEYRPSWALDREPRAAIVARVLSKAGKVKAEAHATCNPNEFFVEELGREIAVGRALKQLQSSKAKKARAGD